MAADAFNTRKTLQIGKSNYTIFGLRKLEADGLTRLDKLPFSIRVLLETALRGCNNVDISEQDVRNLAAW